jgi:hypothetical protein
MTKIYVLNRETNKIELQFSKEEYKALTAEHVWEFGDKLKELITELGYDCSIISDNSISSPMSYRPSDNSIRFNLGRVQGIGMKRGYMLQDTFFCIAYHEIGHFLEIRNNPALANNLKESKQDYNFLYNREEQAYRLGRELIINNRLLSIYDSLNEERLTKLKRR